MGVRASESCKNIGGSEQSGMLKFRILKMDQFCGVVLRGQKVKGARNSRNCQAGVLEGHTESWVRGRLI